MCLVTDDFLNYFDISVNKLYVAKFKTLTAHLRPDLALEDTCKLYLPKHSNKYFSLTGYEGI